MTARVLSAFVFLLVSTYSVTQTSSAGFDGIEKWKGTLTATAITSLKSLYSTDPPARFIGKDQKPTPNIVPETENDRQIDNGKPGPDRQQTIAGVVDSPLPGQMLSLDVIRVKAR
jgi:hypothetical protein